MKKIIYLLLLLIVFPLKISAGELNITAIDYGSEAFGDATLLESNGEYLLIDTGNNIESNKTIEYLKTNNINKLSVYISHIHYDHYGRLKAILNDTFFTIENLYLPNSNHLFKYTAEEYSEKSWYEYMNNYAYRNSNSFNSVIELANQKNIPVTILTRNSKFDIGDAKAEVIWQAEENRFSPDNFTTLNNPGGKYINNYSLVTMIKVDKTKFLTAGDIEVETEEDILNNNIDIKANIYKMSHHAGRTSNIEDFINKVNPEYTYYQYNGDNETTFGTNNWVNENVNRIKNISNVYSSRYNGTTTFNIKNNEITARPERNYYTIKILYKDIDTDEIIKEKDYIFNNASTYHLKNYSIEIPEYKLIKTDKNSQIKEDGNLTENIEYNIYYKKTEKKQEQNNKYSQIVNVPNTKANTPLYITLLGISLIAFSYFIKKLLT